MSRQVDSQAGVIQVHGSILRGCAEGHSPLPGA